MKQINKIMNNGTMLVTGSCCIVCVITGVACFKLGQKSKERELQPSIDELVKRVRVLEVVAFK